MTDVTYKPVARYFHRDEEESWQDLEAYDPHEAARVAPDDVCAFQIFKQPVAPEWMSDDEAVRVVSGEALLCSAVFWIGGQVMTQATAPPDLAGYMAALGADRAIIDRFGDPCEFGNDDYVVTPGVEYVFHDPS